MVWRLSPAFVSSLRLGFINWVGDSGNMAMKNPAGHPGEPVLAGQS